MACIYHQDSGTQQVGPTTWHPRTPGPTCMHDIPKARAHHMTHPKPRGPHLPGARPTYFDGSDAAQAHAKTADVIHDKIQPHAPYPTSDRPHVPPAPSRCATRVKPLLSGQPHHTGLPRGPAQQLARASRRRLLPQTVDTCPPSRPLYIGPPTAG